MSSGVHAIVLAAGKGTRMRSPLPKVLHRVLDRPLLGQVLAVVREAGACELSIVVGHGADAIRASFPGLEESFVLQQPQLGTGHAVMAARPRLEAHRGLTTLVLNGDLPRLDAACVRGLLDAHEQGGRAATLLTARLGDPGAYGRVLRDAGGNVRGIVEARDASPEQARVNEINVGVYAFDTAALLDALQRLGSANAQGEYYLTDVVAELVGSGGSVGAVVAEDPNVVLGVNTLAELAAANRHLRESRNRTLMDAGVALEDPDTISVGFDATLEPGARIRSHTIVEGSSHVAAGASVGPFTRLVDVRVDAEARILDHCVLLQCHVGAGASVGPFAHVRPDTDIGVGARVGNFVELKKTRLGEGSKAPHLSYLGDAAIGPGVNVGAGTITCNYDGNAKHPTRIDAGVFVGSNSTLVAPLHIGAGAYVAAGSVITRDVPADSLSLGRAHQVDKPGYAETLRARRSQRRED